MKLNNGINIAAAIVMALSGFVWVYNGSRAEIAAGVLFFICAISYFISFVGNVLKKSLEDTERKVDVYRDEHIFENYEKK